MNKYQYSSFLFAFIRIICVKPSLVLRGVHFLSPGLAAGQIDVMMELNYGFPLNDGVHGMLLDTNTAPVLVKLCCLLHQCLCD